MDRACMREMISRNHVSASAAVLGCKEHVAKLTNKAEILKLKQVIAEQTKIVNYCARILK